MTVLATSEQVVEVAVVAVSVVVLWSVVAAAVRWHVVAAVRWRIGSSFSVVGGCCRVRSCSRIRIF